MNYPVRNFKERFNTTRGNAYGIKITPTYYHSGNDINSNTGGNTDCGTPLLAVADGEVSSVHSHATGYGNHIHIKHTINGRNYWSHYAHLETMAVSVGQVVREGDVIGTLGNTGNSDYCHLHFEIKNTPTGIDGIAKTKEDLKKWEDPIKFIEANLGNVIISPSDDMNKYTEEVFNQSKSVLPDQSYNFTDQLDKSKFKDELAVVKFNSLDEERRWRADRIKEIESLKKTIEELSNQDPLGNDVEPPAEVIPDLGSNPSDTSVVNAIKALISFFTWKRHT